jgi:hypothetical protein
MDSLKALVFRRLSLCSRLMILASLAGAGKSVLWYYNFPIFSFHQPTNHLSSSSAIIEDILGMRERGQALLGFFYCDFREDQEKDFCGLLSSLLVQLCDQFDAYCALLSDFHVAHGRGSQYASDGELLECLRDLVKIPEQATVYIIVDALDECPKSNDLLSPRDKVLDLVEDLVQLGVPHLRICVTSRPEADIKAVLDPLSSRSISLHSESGQIRDIAKYIRCVIATHREFRRWKAVDKELVIEVITRKADGM